MLLNLVFFKLKLFYLDPHNLRAKGNIEKFTEQLNFVTNEHLNDDIDFNNLPLKDLNKLPLKMFIENKTLNFWLKNMMNNISLDADELYNFESQMAKHVCRHNNLYYPVYNLLKTFI